MTRSPDDIAQAHRRPDQQPAAHPDQGRDRRRHKGFELLGADSKFSSLKKLRRALENARVEFIDNEQKSFEGGLGSLRAGKAKR